MRRTPVAETLQHVCIAAVYFAAGRLGLSLAVINESASAVWPATGIALAAVLLFGTRVAPAVFAGAFLVNIATNGSIGASLAIALGNTLEAVVGSVLVRRYAGGLRAFDSVDGTFRFAGLAAIGATTISATIGLISLIVSGLARPDDYGSIWLTWWLGDVSGAMLAAPLLLLWARREPLDPLRSRPLESLLLFSTTIAVALVVFGGATPAGRGQFPLSFLCLPPLLWAAFRFGPREAATCSTVLAAIAITGTLSGYGPYAPLGPGPGLLLLQAFIVIVTTTSIAAGAETRRRRETEAELRALNEDLERRVGARTVDLQKAQERLAEAQHVAHIGSWEWDLATNAVWWSDELYRVFGVDAGRFGASYEAFLQHIHPEDAPGVDASVREALRERKPFAFEHRVLRSDGDVRIVSGRGDVVIDASGEPVRMRGTAQDITERRRADEAQAALTREQLARIEAEEANRLKDQFLATLSHELRTPLHAVIGWTHMLLRGALEEERQQRAVELIYRNAMLQSQMISDLLDVSRVTSGTLTLEKGLVDLPAVIEAAVETVRPAALEKGIELESHVDEAAWVQGDGKRLAQVANNLLTNAIKFTPRGGRVAVHLERSGTEVAFRVEDTGPGISPSFLPYVFDRFRQQDPTATREHGGLGLGLSIVRHIVELHGGRVTAQNRTDGTGAVFVVTLPALSAQGAAESRGAAAV